MEDLLHQIRIQFIAFLFVEMFDHIVGFQGVAVYGAIFCRIGFIVFIELILIFFGVFGVIEVSVPPVFVFNELKARVLAVLDIKLVISVFWQNHRVIFAVKDHDFCIGVGKAIYGAVSRIFSEFDAFVQRDIGHKWLDGRTNHRRALLLE